MKKDLSTIASIVKEKIYDLIPYFEESEYIDSKEFEDYIFWLQFRYEYY
jgi:hypothetical protein